MNKRIFFSIGIGLLIGLSIVSAKNQSLKESGEKLSEEKIRSQLLNELSPDFKKIEIGQSKKVHQIELIASEELIAINNGKKQNLFSYNGQIPAPEIRIKKGESLSITLKNRLNQATTLHWHGIRIPNEMDGVPDLTQPPVQPGESFTYSFTPPDSGTFWFHPHIRSSEQVEKGLYGALIVEELNEPAKYQQDITWIIDDWRLDLNGNLDTRFNTMHDLAHDGRWGNLITVNGKQGELLNVKPGERIRLRLINVSNGRVYKPFFKELNPRVIAVDGMRTKKTIDGNTFELAPGNRIDLDIIIPKELANKELEVSDQFTRRNNHLGKILVNNSIAETPSFDIELDDKVPNWEQAKDLKPDHVFKLNARRAMHRGIEWTMDGLAFPNHQPLTLNEGEFYKLRFQNDSARLHPMHLHGQFFKVLARNGRVVDEPFWRDTVLVHSRETIDIGIVPFGKGRWANHCHILEHAESGMMSEIIVK